MHHKKLFPTLLLTLLCLAITPLDIHAGPPAKPIAWAGPTDDIYDGTGILADPGSSTLTFNATNAYTPGVIAPLAHTGGSVVQDFWYDYDLAPWRNTLGSWEQWFWTSESAKENEDPAAATFTYNASTKTWDTDTDEFGDQAWSYEPKTTTWSRDVAGQSWSYSPHTNRWTALITDSAGNDGFCIWEHKTETVNGTDYLVWENITTGDVWSQTQANGTLSRYVFPDVTTEHEQWVFGHENTDSISRIDTTNDNWQLSEISTDSGTFEWQLNPPTTPWHWTRPTAIYPRGRWQLSTGGNFWDYNETTKVWDEGGTSNTQSFPTFLPPLPVQQHALFIHAHRSLQDFKKTVTDVPDDNVLRVVDGPVTYDYNYSNNDWSFTTTTSGDDYTGVYTDSTGKFVFDAQWTDSNGTNTNDSDTWEHDTGTNFLGDPWMSNRPGDEAQSSTNVKKHYNTAENIWRNNTSFGTSDGINWQYDTTTDTWLNLVTKESWGYDHTTTIWRNLSRETDQWRYFNVGAAYWQKVGDAAAANGWSFDKTVPKYTNTADGDWSIQAAGELLSTLDTKTYQFVSSTSLWHEDGDTGNTGKDLFPFTPHNVAGQIGTIMKDGQEYVANQGTAEIVALKDEIAAHKVNVETYDDVSFATALATQEAGLLRTRLLATLDKHKQLWNPHFNSSHQATGLTDNALAFLWNPSTWHFPQTDDLFCTFDSYFFTNGMLISFSQDVPTDNKADIGYYIQPSGVNAPTYVGSATTAVENVTPYSATGLSADSSNQMWLSVKDGQVKIGVGQTFLSDAGTTTKDTTIVSHTPTTDIDWSTVDATVGESVAHREPRIHDLHFFSLQQDTGLYVSNVQVRTNAAQEAMESFETDYDYLVTKNTELYSGWDSVNYDDILKKHYDQFVKYKNYLLQSVNEQSIANRSYLFAVMYNPLLDLQTALNSVTYTDATDIALQDDLNAQIITLKDACTSYKDTTFNDESAVQDRVSDFIVALTTAPDPTIYASIIASQQSEVETRLTTRVNNATSVYDDAVTAAAQPLNGDLAPIVDMLAKERDMANTRKTALPLMNAYWSHQHAVLHDGDTTTTQTALSAEATTYNNTVQTLIADGTITMKTALVAPLLLASSQPTTDKLRVDLNIFLEDLAVTTLGLTAEQLDAYPTSGHPYFGNPSAAATALDLVTMQLPTILSSLEDIDTSVTQEVASDESSYTSTGAFEKITHTHNTGETITRVNFPTTAYVQGLWDWEYGFTPTTQLITINKSATAIINPDDDDPDVAWRDEKPFFWDDGATAYSQQWTRAAAIDISGGRTWTQSSSVEDGASADTQTGHYMPLYGRWQSPNGSQIDINSPSWNYNPDTDLWHYVSTDTFWKFDHASLAWQNVNDRTERWVYRYNPGGKSWNDTTKNWDVTDDSRWEWYNLRDKESWYRTTSTGYWNNATTGESWSIDNEINWATNRDKSSTTRGGKIRPTSNFSNIYKYRVDTGLWHLSGDDANAGKNIFPFFPPPPAPQMEVIAKHAIAHLPHKDTTIFDTTSDAWDAYAQEVIDENGLIMPTDDHDTAVNALTTPRDATLIAAQDWSNEYATILYGDWLKNDNSHTVYPENVSRFEEFDFWSPNRWRFFTPGDGLLVFRARYASDVYVGLAKDIPTINNPSISTKPDIYLHITDTYIKVYSQDGALLDSSEEVEIGGLDPDLDIADSLWIRYESGVLSVGYTHLDANGPASDSQDAQMAPHLALREPFYTLDLNIETFSSKANIADIRYFSFSGVDGEPYTLHEVFTLPPALFDKLRALGDAYDLPTTHASQVADRVPLIALRDAIRTAHNPLLTLTTDEPLFSERTTAMTSVNTALTTAADTSVGALSLSSSTDHMNAMIAGTTQVKDVHDDFAALSTELTNLKADIDTAFNDMETESSTGTYNTTADTQQTAADGHLTTLQNSLATIVTDATAAKNIPGNVHLTPWVTMLKEEKALVDVQRDTLAYWRLLLAAQHEGIYTVTTTAATAAATGKTDLVSTLAADLANGDITFYAAIAGIMTLLSRDSFEDTITQVNSALATIAAGDGALEVTDFHVFPSDDTSPYYDDESSNQTALTVAWTALQTYLDDQIPTIITGVSSELIDDADTQITNLSAIATSSIQADRYTTVNTAYNALSDIQAQATENLEGLPEASDAIAEFNAFISRVQSIGNIAKAYGIRLDSLTRIKTLLDQVHMSQKVQTDETAFATSITNAQNTLTTLLNNAHTILESSVTAATTAQAIDGNDELTGWLTLLKEELAVVEVQQSALAYWNAELTARQEAEHSTPGAAATAATTAQTALATTLGADIARGDITFYAAIMGIMKMLSKDTFDATHTQVTSTLATLAGSTGGLEVTDFHAFGGAYYNNASSNKTALQSVLISLQSYLSGQSVSLAVSSEILNAQDHHGQMVYDFGQSGDDPSWSWFADAYDANFDTPDWEDDSASEKWSVGSHHTTRGRLWTNASARPAEAPDTENTAFMYHDPARDRWMHYDPVGGDTSGPAWQYAATHGLWHQIDTDTYWIFNHQSRTWQNATAPNQVWTYQYNATYGWEWYNSDSDQGWQYRDTDERWHINGDPDTSFTITTPTTLRNETASEDYSFVSSTGLWHLDGDTNNTGLQLYPFFPPTPAAQIALIGDRGFTYAANNGITNVAAPSTMESATSTFENTLSSEYGDIPTDAQLATAREPIDTLITNYTDGLVDWYYAHTHLLMPDTDVQASILTDLDNTFTYWNNSTWRLLAASNGLLVFKVKGATSGLKIGFTQTTPSDGVADFSLELNPASTQAKMFAGTTLEDTGSIASDLFVTDYWQEVWIRNTDGVISCGAIENNIIQPAQYSIDITTLGVDAPYDDRISDQHYFSFADTVTGNLEIKEIRTLPVTALTDAATIITAKQSMENAQARQTDQADLVPIRTAVLSAHTPLLSLTDEPCLADRSLILSDVNTALAATAATAAAIETDDFTLPSSQTFMDALVDEMTNVRTTNNAFITHVSTLPALKLSIAALHEAVVTAESTTAFATTADAHQATIDSKLAAQQATLISIVTDATAIQEADGHSHLTPWLTTLKEEKAVIDVQRDALAYFREVQNEANEIIHASFGDLSMFNPTVARDTLTTILGAQLAGGDITFFAAITGVITLLSKDRFDNSRNQVATVLEALADGDGSLEVSDFHVFPSDVSSPYYNDASGSKTAIGSALDLLQSYLDAQTIELEIPDSTTELHASDGIVSVEYDFDADTWDWNVGSYSATYASDVWKDSTAFAPGGDSPAYSEKWSLTTATGDTDLGYQWDDDSATLVGGNTAQVNHNTASQLWTYHTTTGPTWHYDEAKKQWHQINTDTYWVFDNTTMTWHNINEPEEQWQFLYDATNGWEWFDHEDDHGWQYRSDNKWHNSGNSTSWTMTNATTMHNVGDATDYSFSSATNLWHLDGDTENQGIKIFPFFPPVPATQIAHIKERGRTFLANLGDTDLTTKQTTLTDTITALDAALITYDGVVPSSISDPLEATFNSCKDAVDAMPEHYRNMLDPLLDVTHEATLPASTDFSSWSPTQILALSSAGDGFCKLQIKGSGILYLGLSTTTRTDTQVEFTLKLDPDAGTASAWYGGDVVTPLDEQSITNFLPSGAGSWHDTWFSYTDGVFTFGTGTLSHATEIMTGKTTVFTIDLNTLSFDSSYKDKLNDLAFASLAGTTDGAFKARNISVLPTATNAALETLFGTTLPATQDSLNNVLDGQQLGAIKTELLSAQNELVDMAQELRSSNRCVLADANNTNLTAVLSDAIAMRDADPAILEQTASLTTLDGYITCINAIKAVNDLYITQKIALMATETLLTNMHSQIQSETDAATFVTFLTDLQTTLSTQLTSIQSTQTAMVSGAIAVRDTSGNSFMAPWVTMLKEEQALVAMQIEALTFFASSINRKYEILRVSRDDGRTNAEKQAGLNTVQSTYDTARAAFTTSLATNLAAGDITLYTGIVAPLTLVTKLSFDDVRAIVETHYTALDEEDDSFVLSDIHTFPTDRSSPYFGKTDENKAIINAAVDTLTESLEGTIAEIVLTLNPETDEPPAPTIEDLIADEDVVIEAVVAAAETENVEDQSVVASAGETEEEATNVVVETNATVAIKVDTDDRTTAHAKVYMADSAIVPIGQSYIADSDKAVTVSGPVSFVPNASGFIPLSSDIYILQNSSGSHIATPFIAGTNFGADVATRCLGSIPLAQQGKHRIELYSEGAPRNIVIKRGTELNLTSFGKGDTAFGQRIVFGDDVTLIFEPGATLRLPYLEPSMSDRAPILEFSGKNARMVFLADQVDEQERWHSVTDGPDAIRNKILGVGTLRFSGENARMEILHGAMVSVESDYTSPRTDIKFELSGNNAQLCIGTPSIPGGALQIGNPVYGGYDRYDLDNYPNNSTHARVPDIDNLEEVDPFFPITTQIDCSFTLSGNNAQIHLGRQGFLGLGVGVLNKEGNPNGNTLNESIDPTVDESQFNAWRAHSLYNVTSVKFDIQRGSFHHHSVGDGSSTNAAVLAVAPLHERGGYQFKINRQFGKVYGGGNVMFLRKVNLDQTGTASVEERATGVDDSITLDQPVPLHIWSTARNVSGSKATDNGAYSLMAPDQLIRRYVPKHTSSNVSKTGTLYTFTGSADDFYKMLTLQGYKTEDQFYTVLHNVLGTLYVSYVRDDKVIKTTEVSTSDIKAVNDQGVFEVADLSPAELLKQGALLGNQNYSYTVGNTLVLDPINFKPE